ncbi:MAG TPA: efflux RND transporter periplasmic adaptor subunit [Bacteroidales bacterium]|nr:efflux RND transporter periplasmic adaptor subunit [Bacteroidales bacterium]HPF03343.1 efflux RND transporter periplasmic adaptor subunit [Bacteroidales bacterium]HPR13574.1 efflux RND transporter periplasmic adaptor subunit [Bacteroidales bacterium]HRW86609.1 efflux RND transporter periplasmic adaptor subunit [Bacteroidales bacterium]
MNKKIYMVIIPLIITACSGSQEDKDKPVASSYSVNSAKVEVSEVVGVGRVEPEKEIISLASATGGIVKEIYRTDGDSVKKDEPLVRLDDELELIRISQLRSQYISQKLQADIDKLNLQESEARLANKKRLLESVASLASKGAETKQALDDLETEVTALSLAVEKERASVALSASRLRETAEQVRYAEAEADKKILRSPYNGILLELLIEKGSAVNQFETFAVVAPSGPVTVRTEVDELFAGRVRLGLDADIRFVGSDSVVAKGKVIFVSPYLKKKSLFSQKANEQEDRLVREAIIKLEGAYGLLLNSKVESVIKIKSSRL